MQSQQVAGAVAHRSSSASFESVLGLQSYAMSGEAKSKRPELGMRFNNVHIETVDVTWYEGTGSRMCRRRPDHIRTDHADYFLLILPLSAEVGIQQDGREIVIREGSFALMTTTRPFIKYLHGVSGNELFSAIQVKIPGPLLRQRVPGIDITCSQRIDIYHGAGTIMKTIIEQALTDGPSLASTQTRNFSATLIDVIANAASPVAEQALPRMALRKSAHSRIRDRAKGFIVSSLSNPSLRVAMVADYCHVSIRYLHAAFAEASESVESFIKENRLQQCRVALRTNALRNQTIASLAADWGFEDPAHFSHAYKVRFGCPPSRDRFVE